MKKVLSCLSEGETLISEFIQEPLLERDSPAKSSKNTSNLDLDDLTNHNTNNSVIIKRHDLSKQKKPFDLDPEFVSEGYRTNSVAQNFEPGKQSIEQKKNPSDMKNSDLAALYKKREMEAQKPVRFNVMVVGQSGLGKSTFTDAFLDKVSFTIMYKQQIEIFCSCDSTFNSRSCGKRRHLTINQYYII